FLLLSVAATPHAVPHLSLPPHRRSSLFFFFTAPATTEIYTLSLHDALPILGDWLTRIEAGLAAHRREHPGARVAPYGVNLIVHPDRKSTRLNSSHVKISYAVFCLKKKTNKSCPTSTWRSIHNKTQITQPTLS